MLIRFQEQLNDEGFKKSKFHGRYSKRKINIMDYKQFALAFKDIPTPEKIIHNKSYHYLDDIRGKYVPATPEEEVRQKVIITYQMDLK